MPQVYVRLRADDIDDIDGTGALLAGKDVDINITGDLTNSGTIAGRDVVLLNAENLNNLGGRIDCDDRACAGQMQNDLVFALANLDRDFEQLGDDGRWLRLRQRWMLQCLGPQLLVQDIGRCMQQQAHAIGEKAGARR